MIALVGDRNDSIPAHRAIPIALADVEHVWIASDAVVGLDGVEGIWCIPGSPYKSMEGALSAIRHAREKRVPFLGTCGGFQHALIEYARNVLGLTKAEHAESSPDAELALVTPLACSLVNVEAKVTLAPGSRIAEAYGARESNEEYQCRFGLDPKWREKFIGDIAFTAFDSNGDVRGLELRSHPFFVATLFQPERASLRGRTSPLITAFVSAVKSRQRSR